MKAIVLKEYGIPAVLQEQEIDVPVITETQVLVEMYAASINPADSVLRSGAVKDILQFSCRMFSVPILPVLSLRWK